MTEPSTKFPERTPRAWAAATAVAVVVGAAAYWLSCLLVPSSDVPVNFGAQWQQMSRDPWQLHGQFPHRILAPTLAWLLGLGGEGWMTFLRGVDVVMLASAFLVCWRRGGAFVDGALVAVAIALTAAVQMYKEHWVGYADPLCYTLFFWSMLTVRMPLVFWPLWLANLFHHELAGFLLPWLWWMRRREDARWRLDLVCVVVAMAVYLTYYLLVKAQAQQTYSFDYFASHPLFPGGTVAVWLLAAVHWVVAYGPVLAVLAWHQHRRESAGERLHLWLVLLGVLAIFCIAFDWARHSNLIVLPLVVAATSVLRGSWRNRAIFAGMIALGAVLMVVWRPWSSSAWPTCEMSNLTLLVQTGVVIDLDPGEGIDFGFGPLGATTGNWLPTIWSWLWPVAVIGAAIWVLGWALAKWLPRRANGPIPAIEPTPSA
ncbi:MAG: hypothetical protein H6835_09705 [Planctomycetes bacterium]|nr:hypothetical protein [Planctomycetota bacterium]